MLLLRHARASFLTDDYDRLSELGELQARRFGDAWRVRGDAPPTHCFVGPRLRQRETARLVREAATSDGASWPELTPLPALDEHPGDALLAELAPALASADPELAQELRALAGADHRARVRAVDRLLRAALGAWALGAPSSGESWVDYRARLREALAVLCEVPRGSTVLAVSSAGSIGAMVAEVLAAPDTTAIELGLALENASLCELAVSGSRRSLMSFGRVDHLTERSERSFR